MSRLPLLLLLTLVTGFSGLLSAAEPYGLRYLEADAAAKDSGPADSVVPDPGSAGENDTLAAVLALQLEQRELELGPYAPSIAETLLQLARAQEAGGDTAAALKSLARALHLIRVNDGLYSGSQGPVVRALLDVLRREGDYEALDGRYEYFYRLYGVGRPPFNEARWSAVMEYLRWQREALLLRLDGSPANRLLELVRSNDALLSTLEESEDSENGPGDWQRQRDAALSQLHNYYLVDEFIRPARTERLPLLVPRRNRIGVADDLQDYDPQQERLENLQRTLSARAQSVVEAALAQIPSDNARERAELELELADWFQWQGNYREATLRYEQIWARLSEQGLTSLAEQWFSTPVPLPDNGVFSLAERPVEATVTLLLGVSESGRPSVDTDGVPDARRSAARRLRRLLLDSRFRPVVSGGTVQSRAPEARTFMLLDR